MRKIYKKWMEDLVQLLYEAHAEIKKALQDQRIEDVLHIFADCQEGAMKLGELIEKEEGENCATIAIIEEYCEFLYQCFDALQKDPHQTNAKMNKVLHKQLIRIENSIKNDIQIRLEIVFLPYKASMWDSLESIWIAADKDPNCDAYVVPIPYYDRNPDGSFASYHYEGDSFPKDVPITHYLSYDLKENKPDIIYIHNPYDGGNYVTSIDPQYYSEELKKYTDLLVYVPYYVAGGGMNDTQTKCLAYDHVDYIILQSKEYEAYFAKYLPRYKLLPLGSPKFDRVIRLSQNPPKVSEEWSKQMSGKTVYFYNTSIGGMLKDTPQFLKKMRYVFDCFANSEDSCLLWRPHPLLESTFASMRKKFYLEYLALKNMFIQQKLGIYDDTADIEYSIAHTDVYIGDSSSSVVPLFGIAGKPIFVLDNKITMPDKDAWKDTMITGFYADNQMWLVTKTDRLYHKTLKDGCYHYVCDLSADKTHNNYQKAIEMKDKVYICPKRGQDILVLSQDQKVIKQIQLNPLLQTGVAFRISIQIDQYLYLLPNRYPAIVRYDTETEMIDYITDCNDVILENNEQGQGRKYTMALHHDELFFASIDDDSVIALNYINLETRRLHIGLPQRDSCFAMVPYENDIWILPYTGRNITKWNPEISKITTYSGFPKDFACYDSSNGQVCEDKPFRSAIPYKDCLILNPMLGNMFVSINTITGKMEQFVVPKEIWQEGESGIFLLRNDQLGLWTYRFYNETQKRLFDYNLETGEVQEVEIKFDMDEVNKQEAGFCKQSDRLQYACMENAFQTLPDFLAHKIVGQSFNKAEQITSFQSIGANSDGTAGKVIHHTICEKLNKLR